MGRALVLVEALAAALLLVGLVAAWSARSPRGLGRWLLPLAAAALVAVPAGVTAYGLGYLNQMATVSLTSFVTMVVWTVTFLVGSLLVAAAALRAASDPARAWSARSLAVGFAAAAILTAITLSNLDVAVKGQLASLRVEAGAKALA